MTEEIKCPCGEEGRFNCTSCQDLPIWYFDKETQTLTNDIGPVEQVFLTMVKVLDEADQDKIMSELHATANELIAVNAGLRNKLDAMETKLRSLLDNGYFKYCETDIKELLNVD